MKINQYLGLFIVIIICSMGFASGNTIQRADWKINVLDYGAKGDKVTDNTEAFQKALNAAAGKENTGGTVFIPAGNYLFKGHLTIPQNVVMEGIWQIPAAWSQYQGTTLLPTEGEGNEDGTPFITMGANAVLKGITIFYPNQTPTNPPKKYPWTIFSGGGDDISVIDVLVVNPYQLADFGTHPSGRHYIRNLYGQPMLKGIFVDQCYDVGRIENVHLWPFWTCNNPAMKPLEDFIASHGESFIFARTDWEYVSNTFSWGYNIGYHFAQSKSGLTNGNFSGIGADATQISVQVDDCAPYGLLITNGEFVSFQEPHPISVEVKASNSGTIQFQNCSFWGPAEEIADIKGTGMVSFNNCNFSYWDPRKTGKAAIEAYGGNLIVNGCNFAIPQKGVKLYPELSTAVIMGNRFAGANQVENLSEGDVQIGLNVSNKPWKEEKDAIVIDDSASAPAFQLEGNWNKGLGGKDYRGLLSWVEQGKGDKKAYWRPNISKAGKYNVYVWYGGDPGNDHATNAPYTVKSSKEEKTFNLNLKKNWGQWNLLGTFTFSKGTSGYVMATDKADGTVLADAVKFVPVK